MKLMSDFHADFNFLFRVWHITFYIKVEILRQMLTSQIYVQYYFVLVLSSPTVYHMLLNLYIYCCDSADLCSQRSAQLVAGESIFWNG